jgi:hypothetical protein
MILRMSLHTLSLVLDHREHRLLDLCLVLRQKLADCGMNPGRTTALSFPSVRLSNQRDLT